MPIANIQDAQEVEHSFQTILSTPEVNARLSAIRTLFVETLDFDLADQQISLTSAGNDQLPDEAHIVARRDGVSLVYVPLDNANTNRVTGAVASAAAKTIGNVLDDDLLLLFTNRDRDQLHMVNPDLTSSRPRLQRIVAHKDQLQYTVIQQIANMWDNYGNRGKPIREAITIAFSVEPVTKQFFEIYHSIFKNSEDQITGFEDDDQRHRFTQTLFNRLMFVYFLSRKGWLKFKGNTDYLNALWQDHNSLPDQSNFYTSRIKPLFFSGLNNPDSRDLTQGLATLIGDVPFLNGGLFEETNLDKREETNVPNKVIEQIFTDLFDRFNFTVMESTPYDVEVAVDPEMLGKVFEELITGRHDSGAYYTPRPVVSFMCREALKGYLEGKETGLDQDAIARFVDEHDTSGISLVGAPRVSEALSQVTVVDPACGSGAYLLGMMQELIELQTILYNIGVDAKKIYDLKLEIIQRNLYGVDIDEFAVNIAMLRMWLSLAIDYEGDEPEPLPNLDFKVVCGDSLLGNDPSSSSGAQRTLGRDPEQVQRLGQLKAEYMRASRPEDKGSIKVAIKDLEETLRKAFGNAGMIQGAVDWQVEFAEVIGVNAGFDVVVGNPPYVESRSSSVSKSLKEQYRNRVSSEWGAELPGGSDLLMYFFSRSVKLLNAKGKGCFITQNAWLSTDYGRKFQQFSIGRFSFLKIIDSNTRFFASSHGPNINAIISVFTKASVPEFEYGTADNELVVTTSKMIAAKNPMKWGHLTAMPEFVADILFRLSSLSKSTAQHSFGQGLNFPKAQLNSKGASVDVIVNDPGFAAFSADGKISKAYLSKTRRVPALIMPRGIGNRYYCTFNACRAYSFSGVEVYLPDDLWETDTHYCMWAFMNSSFVWLFREITGRKNLGGGMLKAEATDMKVLPTWFDYDFGSDARKAFDSIKNRNPLPVPEEIYTKDHILIDDLVAEYFDFNGEQDRIREHLIQQVNFRLTRSRT